MSDEPIRLRRHVDGRVALKFAQPRRVSAEPQWCVVNGPGGVFWASNTAVTNPGWSELMVAELPEPDGRIEVDGAPYWNGSDDMPSWVAYPDGIETEAGEIVPAGLLRADALKMLAAADTCERLRQEVNSDAR